MIDECFIHCHGIGPKTNSHLKESGYRNWDDCLSGKKHLPFNNKKNNLFIAEITKSIEALKKEDLYYFIEKFPTYEHWRILAEYYDKATYFDIETTGLSWNYSHTSVIVAYCRGEVHEFVYGENLDDFLDLVDESKMLVTFNGNCFDLPFLERTFNLPEICCPHLDLRWVAYHQGYRGGLKQIEKELDIYRPSDIEEVDGFEAVELYHKWQQGDIASRDKLLKYCTADVLSLYSVTLEILSEKGVRIFKPDKNKYE